MTKPDENGLVQVMILDKEYSIRSGEEEKVRRIADYLNEQIDRIRSRSPVLNKVDLSVMAAFQAASDYFRVRDKMDDFQRAVESRSSAIATKISNSLGE